MYGSLQGRAQTVEHGIERAHLSSKAREPVENEAGWGVGETVSEGLHDDRLVGKLAIRDGCCDGPTDFIIHKRPVAEEVPDNDMWHSKVRSQPFAEDALPTGLYAHQGDPHNSSMSRPQDALAARQEVSSGVAKLWPW